MQVYHTCFYQFSSSSRKNQLYPVPICRITLYASFLPPASHFPPPSPTPYPNNSFKGSFFSLGHARVSPHSPRNSPPPPSKLCSPSFFLPYHPSRAIVLLSLCPRERRASPPLTSSRSLGRPPPLPCVPFAPCLVYCITVHEVANLRRVILYKYVSQINNRPGDMSPARASCSSASRRPRQRRRARRQRRCRAGMYTMKWPDSWNR